MSPVKDEEKSVWLSGEEIRRDVIEHYKTLAKKTGVDFQVIFDCCKDIASDEELGYEEAALILRRGSVTTGSTTFINGDER